MNSQQIQAPFDPRVCTETVIAAVMRLLPLSEPNQAELRRQLEEQVDQIIMKSLSRHLEPEAIDRVLEQYGESGDSEKLFVELLKASPASQQAIAEALDRWTEESVRSYTQLASNF